MERFVGIDVPDPGHHALIEQGHLHGPAGGGQAGVKDRAGHMGRLRSQTAQESGAKILTIPGEMDPAEPARVDELQPVATISRLDRPDHVSMGGAGPAAARPDEVEPPGHAEPNHESAVRSEADHELLSPAAD